eukprot:scaffold301870_cov17-Prasinocladus_malaysianus.AAC.1
MTCHWSRYGKRPDTNACIPDVKNRLVYVPIKLRDSMNALDNKHLMKKAWVAKGQCGISQSQLASSY